MLDKNELKKLGIKVKEEDSLLNTLKRHYPHIFQDGKISLKRLKDSLAKALNLQGANELENMQNLGGYELNFTGKALANALYNSECEKELKLDEICELNTKGCHDFALSLQGEIEIAKSQSIDKDSKAEVSLGDFGNKAEISSTQRAQYFGDKNGALQGEARELPQTVMTEAKPKQSPFLAQKTSPYAFKVNNMIIKGDNLDALKILKSAYSGKIKMIYIDPPYNTQSDNFIYPDNFRDDYKAILREVGLIEINENGEEVESENLKFFKNITGSKTHSGWLCFMLPRLKLARDLLKDDGVIFISIDDNEQANLKLLCDEIFGEDNFVACMIRKTSASARLDAKFISNEIDFCLFYAKNIQEVKINKNKIELEGYNLKDEHFNTRGGYKLNKLDRGSISYTESLIYGIETPDKSIIYPGGTQEDNGWAWRWSKEKVKWGIENDFIVFKKGKNSWSVYFKQYEFVDNNLNKIERKLPFKNLLLDFYNEYGTNEVKNIFNTSEAIFSNPKPTSFIEHLLKIATNTNKVKSTLHCHSEGVQSTTEESTNTKNNSTSYNGYFANAQYDKDSKSQSLAQEPDIILDFFAGSGTTAQAVMELNAEDGGNREFILVQIEEEIDEKKSKTAYDFAKLELGSKNPVISDITIERVKRAAKKIYEKMKINDKKDSKAEISQKSTVDSSASPQNDSGGRSMHFAENTIMSNFNFKVFSLKDKAKIITDDKNSLKIEDKSDLSPFDKALNLILQSGNSLNKNVKTIIENKLYECENAYFVVSLDKEVLAFLQEKSNEIYLNGFDIKDLEGFLNLTAEFKENIKVIF